MGRRLYRDLDIFNALTPIPLLQRTMSSTMHTGCVFYPFVIVMQPYSPAGSV